MSGGAIPGAVLLQEFAQKGDKGHHCLFADGS
jgi:hypothetical protein